MSRFFLAERDPIPGENDDGDIEFFVRAESGKLKCFVCVTENKIYDFLTMSEEDIMNNVKYDESGKKVYDVNKYNKLDVSRTVFPNTIEVLKNYSNIKDITVHEDISIVFDDDDKNVDVVYMQCHVASNTINCFDDPELEPYLLKSVHDYMATGNKYPGHDPDFKMPSPKEIEEMRNALNNDKTI